MTKHEPQPAGAGTPNAMDRRDFVRHGAVAGLGVGVLGSPAILRGRNLNDSLSVAVMGVNSRGAARESNRMRSRPRAGRPRRR